MDVWKGYLGVPLGWAVKKFFSVVGQSIQDGAAGGLYLAASEDIIEDGDGVRGEYFIPIATRCETSEIAGDMELAGELWVSISSPVQIVSFQDTDGSLLTDCPLPPCRNGQRKR